MNFEYIPLYLTYSEMKIFLPSTPSSIPFATLEVEFDFTISEGPESSITQRLPKPESATLSEEFTSQTAASGSTSGVKL